MDTKTVIKSTLKPLSLCVLLALGGCWFDGSSSGKNSGENQQESENNSGENEETVKTTKLEGTTAVGAPLVGANINLNCAGYAKQNATTTNSTGQWSFAVPTANLPCVVSATGGTANGATNQQALYTLSLANQTNANITPITSLALAHAANAALGMTLQELAQTSNLDFQKLNGQINASMEKLKQDLLAKGYSYPSTANFNPLITPFAPQAGNAYDDLLEALMTAAQAANTSWNTLLSTYAAGGSLPAVSSNTGGNNNGGNNNGGSTNNPIRELGLATLSGYSTANQSDFFAGVKGTYPVAIYRAPAGKESQIGEGSLSISGTVANWSMQLKAADGTIISSLNSNDVFIDMLTPFVGQVFLNGGTTPDKYLSTYIKANGFIEGVAGGQYEYGFRNNIVSYGEKVPAVFNHLVGKWQGKTAATLCGVNDVNIEIGSAGKVSTSGTDDVKCTATSLELTWDGNDDYIEKDGNTYNIYLDSKPDGTGKAKTIRLGVNTLDQVPSQISASTKVSGGSFNTKNAVIDDGGNNTGGNGGTDVEFTTAELAAKSKLGGLGGATGVVDGATTFTYFKARSFSKTTDPYFIIDYRAEDDKGDWNIAFPTKSGTYPCAEDSSLANSPYNGAQKALLSLNLTTTGVARGSAVSGGSCTVKVKITDTAVEGVFSGTLSSFLGAKNVISAGYFYHPLAK